MFPSESGSKGSKGFPATGCFARWNIYSNRLGGSTLFTPPVFDRDVYRNPHYKVSYNPHSYETYRLDT
jgi:hypothetical protein